MRDEISVRYAEADDYFERKLYICETVCNCDVLVG